MECQPTTLLRIGAWCVNPACGEISRDGETVRLEARSMRLLLCLAGHPGEVVSIDDLLNQVWSPVTVTPDSVYQAVASLRRQLGDDPKQPIYIATVPRLGYRMVASVSPWTSVATAVPPAGQRVRARFQWAVFAVLCLATALVFALTFRGKVATNIRSMSIAVLPFLDLTDAMAHEIFADGMTEELIDKFSKIPGLQVASPTSSFYFKGKTIPVADIAKRLGVAYVLDGSVRKSGVWIRVDARLIRAESGYVVWSETYDRPSDDLLKVQDDIAGEVTKALQAAIVARPL